ncbi:MAG: UvrD-helicase domain-containing protein [Flavobacteriales bacterium]|nr:UvrD-helicase domain-containing protein [Flavobacteriales bacterium]
MKNFTIYKSSAGSGKTYTLVKEYLKLAINGKDEDAYRRILAITFTNKAAKEMRERILLALKELSSDEPLEGTSKIMMGDLTKELGFEADVIKLRCGMIHQSILHNYSFFSISTIDKFVHKIVKTFARDLRISSDFEVELEYELMLRKAIDQLISKVGSDAGLTKLLVAFTETKTEEEKSWNIEDDLYKFFGNLMNEEGYDNFNLMKAINMDDFMEIRKTLFEKLSAFEKPLKVIGEQAVRLISDTGVSPASFPGGANGLNKYFTYLKNTKHDKLCPSQTIQNNMEEDKWFSAKADVDQQSKIESIKGQLSDWYSEALQIIQKYPEYMLFRLLSRNIYSLAVLNETEKLLEELKAEHDFIFISDFNKKINNVVQNEPAPFIFERMGEKYANFLIDEFQDTSLMQWQNLLPLVENSLANGNFNMIVGDGKQSIYRFRGGDVEQFVRLPIMYPPPQNELQKMREEILIANQNPKMLASNYRSKKEVIDFNNWFFRQIADDMNEVNQLIYHELEQAYPPGNSGGMIQVEVLEETDKEAHRHLTHERVKCMIADAVEDGYHWKDIAILCRRNSDGGELAKFLMALKIDVLSSESLLLSHSKEVAFLVNMLSLLIYPNDENAQVKVLQFLKEKSIIDGEVHLLIQDFKPENPGPTFFEFLKEIGLETDISRIIAMPLYDTVEELIRIYSLKDPIDPYISFFLDAVHGYAVKFNNVIPEFLNWWEAQKNKTSIVIPEGLDAVRVLTIHKSKGLEFPVVIFPYANWSIKNTKDQLWVDVKEFELGKLPMALIPASKDLELTKFGNQYLEEKDKSKLDTVNVLYVALTRTRERLYMLTSHHKTKKVSQLFLPFLQSSEYWNEEAQMFIQGERGKSGVKPSDDAPALTLNKFVSKSWHGRISVRLQANEIWDVNEPVKSEDYGNLVHRALSYIETNNDIDKSVQRMLLEGFIDDEEKDILTIKLEQLINNKEILPYFKTEETVRNEAEILLPDGSTFRPDRVLLSNDKATVIDYKTGKESDEHLEQVKQYGHLLKEMGYSEVKSVLIYTEQEKVVEA